MHPTNFRDVGEALTLWLDRSPVPSGRLLRGGRLDELCTLEELGHPRTILNLRSGADPTHLGIDLLHVPASNRVENYQTESRAVRTWLGDALLALAAPGMRWPVYIHCTSGRDRTGLVVAAALRALGVPREAIVGEYLLSEGASQPLIEQALNGLEGTEILGASDLAALRRGLCD